MKKTPRNLLVAIALTMIAAMFVFAANTARPFSNNRFFDFPLTIGEWEGRDIKMSDYVYQLIDTKYLFLRDYQSPRYTVPVNLSIVWFDDTDIAFHAPEACLGGVGHKVREKTTANVTINGNDHTLGKLTVGYTDGKKAIVLYYFDVDGYWTTSQADIRLHILGKRLLFKRASASFIRLMAPVSTSEEDTINMIRDFLETAVPVMPEHLYTEHVR
ncbi:MAG: exosortase C-terminal domain/associated protein EpsI [Desulfomonilia bacterium]